MKKYHWHVFQHEKLFKKQPLPHCQFVLQSDDQTFCAVKKTKKEIKSQKKQSLSSESCAW
jgi:hypothetical protein